MKWGRLLFAIISGMACVSFLLDKQNNLALFFGAVSAISVWSMSWGGDRGKNNSKN